MAHKHTPNQLINLREKAGLSQQQMADKLDINIRLYQKYEGAETRIRHIVWLAAQHVVNCDGK